jgi:hypothetical protein
MTLKKSPIPYLDGPCRTIEVLRCGVATAIGARSVDMLIFQADVNDPNTVRFDALVNELQGPVFAFPWQGEFKEPSPEPSPARSP